jgi:hypothetical protein
MVLDGCGLVISGMQKIKARSSGRLGVGSASLGKGILSKGYNNTVTSVMLVIRIGLLPLDG